MLENEFLEGVSKMREASRAMGSPAQASLSLSNPASEANTPLQTKNVLKKPLKLICFKGFMVRDEGLEPPRSPART